MIIYNVTVNVDESIHDSWVEWMRKKHIKDVLNTGKFASARFVKVLVDESMGGVTYATQYVAYDREHLDSYLSEDAPKLREEGLKLFADKMLAFRTELEIIEEFQQNG